MTTFLQQTINGITVGSVYALIGLGYTMVYGIIELINFAHGEVYMVGAYIGIIVLAACGSVGLLETAPLASLAVSVCVSCAMCGAYGYAIEKTAYRPLRKAGRLSPLISALGVSIILQNFVMLSQGTRGKIFPPILPVEGMSLGGASVTWLQIAIILSSGILMAALHVFITRTRLGTAMRASAQDATMAAMTGINVNSIISLTFIIGSVLAGAAGVMVGMYYGVVNYSIGYIAGMKAFTAAVLGGIGNIPGAMVGGLLLGLLENYAAGYISGEFKDIIAFAILILILIVKPTGLLGEEVTSRS